LDARECCRNELFTTGLSVPAMINRSRNNINEPAECGSERHRDFVNVGVVELDVLEQNDSRQIMQKLGPLSKNAVSYSIAFDHEIGTAGNLKAAPEVFGDPADRNEGFASTGIENHDSKAVVVVFPVSACNDNGILAANEQLLDGSAIEAIAGSNRERIHLGIAPGQRIPMTTRSGRLC